MMTKPPPPALVIVAHGSRIKVSNDEVHQLVEAIAQETQHEFSYVGVGFLECTEPSIPEALASAVDYSGKHDVSDILVYPYFLAKGSHVGEDIPSILKAEQARYPEYHFRLLPYMGKDASLRDVIISQLRAYN